MFSKTLHLVVERGKNVKHYLRYFQILKEGVLVIENKQGEFTKKDFSKLRKALSSFLIHKPSELTLSVKLLTLETLSQFKRITQISSKWLQADIIHSKLLVRGETRDKLYQFFKLCKKPSEHIMYIPSSMLAEDFNLLSMIPARK